MTNVQAVIERILVREGGVADVGDGAGVTRWGQTNAWLATYGLPVPTSRAEAADNYARWMAMVHLDAVCDFDLELGDDVCDAAVNEGVLPAVQSLQRPLGVTADGVFGPGTIAAMQKADPHVLRCAVLAEDIQYHGRLIATAPTRFAKFAGGWANRQAEKVRRLA